MNANTQIAVLTGIAVLLITLAAYDYISDPAGDPPQMPPATVYRPLAPATTTSTTEAP